MNFAGDSNATPQTDTRRQEIEHTALVEVPQVQEIGLRNRIVNVPEIHVKERIQTKIKYQDVVRRVPKIKHVVREKTVVVPRVEIIDKEVYVPFVQEVVRYVPKPEVREVVRNVHVEVVKYEEKIVEVPQTEYIDKIVEVPQVVTIVKHVPKIQVVELAVEVVKHVPIKEIRQIEKIRFVPGPVQYCDTTYDKPVTQEVYDIIEKIVEVPVEEEIIVEKCVTRPVKGPVIEVPIETIKYVDQMRYEEVPGRVIFKEIPFDVEHVEEIKIPEYHEVERRVPKERIVHVERVHEVEVPEYVEEIHEVPEYVYFQEPPQIIIPKRVEKLTDLPDVYETAEPRFVHDAVEYLPPIYDEPLDPIVRDETVYMPAESSVLLAAEGSTANPTESQKWLQPAAMGTPGIRESRGPMLSHQPLPRNLPSAFPSFPTSTVYCAPSTAVYHHRSKDVTPINSNRRTENSDTDTSLLKTFSNVWKAAERFGSVASSRGHVQACEKFKSANATDSFSGEIDRMAAYPPSATNSPPYVADKSKFDIVFNAHSKEGPQPVSAQLMTTTAGGSTAEQITTGEAHVEEQVTSEENRDLDNLENDLSSCVDRICV